MDKCSRDVAASTTHHCGCGAWLGEPCAWDGPLSGMVVVEWMPEYLRSSHEAARNSGRWPHNGSVRVAVERECAELLLEGDHEWSSIVRGADPADYVEESSQ